MAEYLIQDSTLTAIADGVRRLTGECLQGTPDTYTPLQMINALDNELNCIIFKQYDSIRSEWDTWTYTFPKMTELWHDTRNDMRSIVVEKGGSYKYVYFEEAWYAWVLYLPNTAPGASIEGYADLNVSELYAPNISYVYANAFYGCKLLTKVTLNTNTIIQSKAFANCGSPSLSGGLKVYLRGTTMGDCADDAFEYISGGGGGNNNDGGGGGNNNDGGADGCDTPLDPAEYLTIYVPSALVNTFKYEWANGAYADCIYALPDE